MIYRATADRAEVLAWLADRLGMTPRDLVWTYPYELLAVRRGGRLIGAVLYINWHGASIEAHWAGEPGWLTRSALVAMFRFAFDVLGVDRMVGLIPVDNAVACRVAEKLGFVREGTAREADRNGGDIALYAMLRRECRWINGQVKSAEAIRREDRNQCAVGCEQHRLQAVG